jgi:hypothetical protein
MAPKSIGKGKDRYQQAPPGIQDKDWANTPISVRKFVTLMIEPIEERIRNPENRFPFLITLLINFGIVTILTIYLEGKVTFRCITPHQVGPLSVAIISLIPLHLIWRNISTFISPNEDIKVGIVTIPIKAVIAFLNEMQIWRIPSRLLGLIFLLFLLVGAFLNLSRNSPFYTTDEFSAIQGFSVQRFDKKIAEFLPIGGTLTIKANEKVLVDAVFRNKVETTCTWYSALISENHKTGCFIVLDEPAKTDTDYLTVRIQSACGTQDFAGLHVEIKP